MAGAVHESVLELIREHPFLLKTLLEAQGLELSFDELQVPAESDLGQLQPTQHRADLVFVCPGKQAVIVEVQNRRDAQKQFTWPLYTASLHEREACETLLIVIATKDSVAQWARQTIPSFQPPLGFQPYVLGPESIPKLNSAAEVAHSPALGVFSAMVHAPGEQGIERIKTTLEGIKKAALDSSKHSLYIDMVCAALSKAQLEAMEEHMRTHQEPFSEIFRKHYRKGRNEGLEEGLKKGLEEGRSKGLEEGRSKGLEEGRSKGLEEGRSKGLEEGRTKGLEEGQEMLREERHRWLQKLETLARHKASPNDLKLMAQIDDPNALEAIYIAILERED